MSFEQDNHSPNSISLEKLDVAADCALLIRKNYSLVIDEQEFHLIGGVNVNSKNYCDSHYYFKQLEDAGAKNYVLNFPTITEALISADIPCARFVENKQGEEITYDERSDTFIYVQEYIKGDFYSGSKRQFEQALKLLMNFRKWNCSSANVGRQSPFLTFSPVDLLSAIEKKLINCAPSQFNQNVSNNLPHIKELLKSLYATLKELHKATNDMHHYDLHPHNLIFRDDELVALVDLESILNIQREICESFALYKLGRKSISKGCFSVEDFREASSKEGFDLNRLKPFIQAEILRRLFLIMDLHFLKGNSDWSADFSKHLNSLKEIDLMFN